MEYCDVLSSGCRDDVLRVRFRAHLRRREDTRVIKRRHPITDCFVALAAVAIRVASCALQIEKCLLIANT